MVTGDRIRVDLGKGRVDLLVSDDEIKARRQELEAAGGYRIAPSQTPWQALQRAAIGQLETGAALEDSVQYQRIAETFGVPRDNH